MYEIIIISLLQSNPKLLHFALCQYHFHCCSVSFTFADAIALFIRVNRQMNNDVNYFNKFD